MKKYFLIIIVFYSIITSGQKINNMNYSGIIILNNGTPLSFEMKLKESKGIVNGFSITGKGTNDETKSDISGVYNKKKKSYILKETQVLETKSEANLNSFCYINMEIKEIGKLSKKRIEGDFTGYFSDGRQCASGKVLLIKKEKLEKKIEKINKKLDNLKKKDEKEKDKIIQTTVLRDGENMEINWVSEKITLYIWDASEEDGDKISLKINDEYIIKDLETKRKRKKIKCNLKKGVNIIEITAVNLGRNPPNTSRIELVDENMKYPIITQLKINESAIIKILY